MAKGKRVASRTRVMDDVPEFTVFVPVGTERVVIRKDVVRKLLQSHTNLEIEDFNVISENDSEKLELVFSSQEIR